MNFFDKLKTRLNKTKENIDSGFNRAFAQFRTVNEELMEELEEMLILSDISMETVIDIMNRLRNEIKVKNIKNVEEIKIELKNIIINILEENSFEEYDEELNIILVIGVNGVR